ncbi:hypothetical protein A3D45_00810 [Candidatus Falkowbacteria bacterium RIFCSPHIGHO2_02_FULL_42_9]|uniref:DUF5666 domain-containing protein n=2 Tax=Candidatus Falkowiibacteriota TaxID=1752728 RepID=A0A1F5S975_9BACT|nr:MAG: hypothetical protein A3D45_00810 [Candidatus Falkowbacteria bacterium RIFCSPHIGHO2_02_FULL_42_9]
MSLKEMFKPTHLNKLLIILATMVVLVFVFSAGVLVGHEKGRFSRNWGENYYRNIIGPGGRGRGMMDFGRPEFNAHSGFGQIIKIEGNSLVVKGPDNVEKTIVINDQTAIQKFNQSLKIADLRVDDYIVVIGRPNNQGQVEARLIRVMPAPMFNNANNENATDTNADLK